MMRKSRREIDRWLEDLEYSERAHTDATLFVAPDASVSDAHLPDVETDGIRARNDETGRREVVVPYHRPDQWWNSRLPVVPESVIAAVSRRMTDEQLARERELRAEHDDPVPPILEESA